MEALIHWLNAKKKIILQTLWKQRPMLHKTTTKIKSARDSVILTVRNQLITNNQSQRI